MGRKCETKKYYMQQSVVFLALTVMAVAVVAIIYYGFRYNYFKGLENLPEMSIKLDGITLEEIEKGPKDNKYSIDNLIYKGRDRDIEVNDATIEGRGNFSWMAQKKSYNIRFKKKIKLTEGEKQKKYALIANSLDDTSLRNDVGFYVARLINEKYPISGDYVKLNINDDDRGLYYLANTLRIGKDEVDLRDQMGILVEIDNAYCREEENYYVSSVFDDCLTISDAVDDELENESIQDFMKEYNEFEYQVKNGNYEEAAKYADMNSWAEYYLLSEFTGNIDAYVTSWYLYKDGFNNKIYTGLGWDYDAAFGNKNWAGFEDDFFSPMVISSRLNYFLVKKPNYVKGTGMGCEYEENGGVEDSEVISLTLCYMVDMPEFDELVGNLYKNKLMKKRDEIISYVKEKASYIRDEAIKDNERWNKGNFDEAVDYLVWWIDKRFDLFDGLYGGRNTQSLRGEKVI